MSVPIQGQGYYGYSDPYLQSYRPSWGVSSTNSTMPYYQGNIQSSQQMAAQNVQQQPKEEKIGFFGKLWNGVKGVAKGVINGGLNMVKGALGIETDENGQISWNPLKMLKSAAMIGACFIPGVGPFVAAGLCAYGVMKSAPGVINGIAGVMSAETAEQAEAAGMQVGGDALTLGLSLVGLKASLGAVKSVHSAGMNAAKALPEGAKFATQVKAYANGAMKPVTITPDMTPDEIAQATQNAAKSAADGAGKMTFREIGGNMVKGTWKNLRTFGGTARKTVKDNNPFTKKGRSHISDSLKTKYNNMPGRQLREILDDITDLQADMAEAYVNGNAATAAEMAVKLKQLNADYGNLTAHSMSTFRYNKMVNKKAEGIEKQIKDNEPYLDSPEYGEMAQEQATSLQTQLEAQRALKQPYITANPFDYSSPKMAIPAAIANTQTSTQYIAQQQAAYVPTSNLTTYMPQGMRDMYYVA